MIYNFFSELPVPLLSHEYQNTFAAVASKLFIFLILNFLTSYTFFALFADKNNTFRPSRSQSSTSSPKPPCIAVASCSSRNFESKKIISYSFVCLNRRIEMQMLKNFLFSLQLLLSFLQKVVSHEAANKMGLNNVAMIMAPNLFFQNNAKINMDEAQKAVGMTDVLRMLIKYQQILWTVSVIVEIGYLVAFFLYILHISM